MVTAMSEPPGRRVFVAAISSPGEIELAAPAAHHVRDVLRLSAGDRVALFDAAGRTANAILSHVVRDSVVAQIESIAEPHRRFTLTIASAVPKGERADWLVEKLGELGVSRWVPLRTSRSVVHPEAGKFERWKRIAIEAARQSHAPGVLEIAPLTTFDAFIASLDPTTTAIASTVQREPGDLSPVPYDALLIGPEGGWTEDELARATERGIRSISLGTTILRIETAAIVGASVVIQRIAATKDLGRA